MLSLVHNILQRNRLWYIIPDTPWETEGKIMEDDLNYRHDKWICSYSELIPAPCSFYIKGLRLKFKVVFLFAIAQNPHLIQVIYVKFLLFLSPIGVYKIEQIKNSVCKAFKNNKNYYVRVSYWYYYIIISDRRVFAF